MESQNLVAAASVAVSCAGVLIAWLKFRHVVRARKDHLKPQRITPFVVAFWKIGMDAGFGLPYQKFPFDKDEMKAKIPDA